MNTNRADAEKAPRRTRKAFYAAALSEAERLLLSSAEDIEGLDEEIALLRVGLHRAIAEEPENVELRLKLINMVVRAVAARYRLSPKAEGDLSQHMAAVLRGIGGVMWPEGFDGIGRAEGSD
ncbi:MAG: hypothetical protein HYX92_10615 [Chloroflexi bacterium]|nr:hypothetical protein [Chloroflexota bacterium]